MPIDPEFPKNHQIIGKHKNAAGRYHFVWGPGRTDAESSENGDVQEAYKQRNEEYVGLKARNVRSLRLGFMYC